MVLAMSGEEYAAAVAAFIRNSGVTRCPTACVSATQASPAPGDRAALARHAEAGELRPEPRRRQPSGAATAAVPANAAEP